MKGPIFAIVTPFDDNGLIDEMALVAYLQFLQHHGVSNIVVNGTSGEFVSLTFDERLRLLALSRASFGAQIINNVSSCCAHEANRLAKSSIGADALLLLPPFYFDDLSDLGIVKFYQQALAGIELPVYLYNFPRFCQNPLTVELVKAIREVCPQVVGMKDSSGDLSQVEAYLSLAGFEYWPACDRQALEILKLGCNGSVSGGSSGLPEYLVRMQQAWGMGYLELATHIQTRLDRWNDFVAQTDAPEIALVKQLLAERIEGFKPHVRPPLVGLSALEIKITQQMCKLLVDSD